MTTSKVAVAVLGNLAFSLALVLYRVMTKVGSYHYSLLVYSPDEKLLLQPEGRLPFTDIPWDTERVGD